MLTKTGYDIIILQGLQSLRREIDEAEQFTIQQYNQHIQEEKQHQEQQANNQHPAQSDIPTTDWVNTEEKPERKPKSTTK